MNEPLIVLCVWVIATYVCCVHPFMPSAEAAAKAAPAAPPAMSQPVPCIYMQVKLFVHFKFDDRLNVYGSVVVYVYRIHRGWQLHSTFDDGPRPTSLVHGCST